MAYIVNKGTQTEKHQRNISVAKIKFILTIYNIKLLRKKSNSKTMTGRQNIASQHVFISASLLHILTFSVRVWLGRFQMHQKS